MNTSSQSPRPLNTLYFLLFIGLGSYMPFVSIFFKRVLVDAQGKTAVGLIGIIFSVMPYMGVAASVLASIMADRLQIGRKIIAVLSFGTAIASLCIAQVAEPWCAGWGLQERFVFVFGFMLLLTFFMSPIGGLLDAEALHYLNRHSQREKYGTIRLWGTYGWSVACIVIGAISSKSGDIAVFFYGAALGFLLVGISAWRDVSSDKVTEPIKIPFDHLRRNKPFLIYLIFCFFNGIAYYTAANYLGYFFDDVFKSLWHIGIVFGTWTIFEIPVMIYSESLIRRFGSRNLIVAGLLFNCLRLFLFSVVTLQTPFMVKWAVALLQGPGFALTFIGMIDMVDRFAHVNMRATYLGTSNIVQNTIGASCGGLLGGWMIAVWGSPAMLRLTGFFMLILILFFIVWVKSAPSPKSLVGRA